MAKLTSNPTSKCPHCGKTLIKMNPMCSDVELLVELGSLNRQQIEAISSGNKIKFHPMHNDVHKVIKPSYTTFCTKEKRLKELEEK